MNKMKKLIETRNLKLDEADKLVTLAETETRSLNDTESASFDALTNEIKKLDTEIKEVEEVRKSAKKIENMEVTNMENIKETEVRGLEQYLRKQEGKEVRALVTTTNGGAVIPENVEGTIIKKMAETSPVFEKARKFPSVNGTLKVAKETSVASGGFVGEGVDIAELAIGLGEVKLTQKRVGAAISLSNQLINDSAVNIVDYSVELLSRAVAKSVEKSILTGDGVDEFAGMLVDTDATKVTVVKEAGVTVDALMELYNSIHPEFIGSSSFIMSRKYFNIVSKLKDGNGHFYLQNGIVNGKPTYTLFGAEVIVSDSFVSTEEGVHAIFGSVSEAYGVMIKQGFALQHVVGDTTQALRGSQLLMLDGYMDGAVINPQAYAMLEITLV